LTIGFTHFSQLHPGSNIALPIVISHLISHAHHSNQTKMGLGLYISKNIIEKHGGKVWAENNTNREKGATFGFSLPLTN